MLHMCVYMHSRFIENHPIRILEDGPLISEGVLSHELCNFFIHKIGEEEMFFQVQQRVIDFYSNSLLMELFVNCLESNNMTSIGNTPNGSMTMM
jgi:hypothetical protein